MQIGTSISPGTDAASGEIKVEFVSRISGNPAGRTFAGNEYARILLRRGANVFGGGDESPFGFSDHRRAVILIAHELLHALGIDGHVSPDFDTLMAANADMYHLRQGDQQPASLVYPVDREALRALYSGNYRSPIDFGPWSATSTHLHGNGPYAGFGVAFRNGYAEPYAYGPSPAVGGFDSANAGLSGMATWNGALLGFTPDAEPVAGDAEIGVNLASMTGRADFTSLETWAANAAPGEKGTGSTWLDGDLGYMIAVSGNTFRETGGDDGILTGIFTGPAHEGAAGTLERHDLTAAFGAAR